MLPYSVVITTISFLLFLPGEEQRHFLLRLPVNHAPEIQALGKFYALYEPLILKYKIL
jgi:hypothetical protein